jgi:hypothetical protein
MREEATSLTVFWKASPPLVEAMRQALRASGRVREKGEEGGRGRREEEGARRKEGGGGGYELDGVLEGLSSFGGGEKEEEEGEGGGYELDGVLEGLSSFGGGDKAGLEEEGEGGGRREEVEEGGERRKEKRTSIKIWICGAGLQQ